MTLRAAIYASTALAFAGAMTSGAFAAEPPPLPAGVAEQAVWYVVIDGQKIGPLTESAVARRMRAGEIQPSALAWREGMAEWTPVASTMTFVGRDVAASLGKPRPRIDRKFALAAL